MKKKLDDLIKACEKCIGKETKIYDNPGKPHEHLSKCEDDHKTKDVECCMPFFGKLMFISTKLILSTESITRALARIMQNPNDANWNALGRMIR